jgi:hypothetical protein
MLQGSRPIVFVVDASKFHIDVVGFWAFLLLLIKLQQLFYVYGLMSILLCY